MLSHGDQSQQALSSFRQQTHHAQGIPMKVKGHPTAVAQFKGPELLISIIILLSSANTHYRSRPLKYGSATRSEMG